MQELNFSEWVKTQEQQITEYFMNNLPLPEVEEIEQPRNQWHAQLIKQANSMPVSQKLWPTAPDKQSQVYDWPENAI